MSAGTGMVVVGGGVAAVSVATGLREGGYDGPVTVLSRELERPYHRPPVSKGLLAGTESLTEVVDEGWWRDHDVDLRTRTAVKGLDVGSRQMTTVSGEAIGYDRLCLATGALVRRLSLPGLPRRGIHYLRTPHNAATLRAELGEGPRRVVLVGGSFVSTETAATLAELGHECTIVLRERHCLDLHFPGSVASFVEGVLASQGVRIVAGVDLVGIRGDETVTGVETTAGTIPADAVVVGIGAIPDVKLAQGAGLRIGTTGGVQCDATLQTSVPDVFAAGDMCEYDSRLHGGPVRIEHERHAQAQGRCVAANMLDGRQSFDAVPSFWSDLGRGVRLEYVGIGSRHDREVLTGEPEAGSFTAWYLRSGALVGALGVGRPEDLEEALIAVTTGSLPDRLAAAVSS